MHDQAEDRCHRIGQRDAVTAWYLLAADTIDETMAELIQSKRRTVAAVTDGRRIESDGLVDEVIRAAARRRGLPAPANGRPVDAPRRRGATSSRHPLTNTSRLVFRFVT